MAMNHAGTFQLKARGDATIEVSKAAYKLRKSNKKKTKNGSTEVPEVPQCGGTPRDRFFKGTHFHLTDREINGILIHQEYIASFVCLLLLC